MARILELLERHERAREGTLSLVPSENATHPEVARALGSDASGRYGHSFYGGQQRLEEAMEAVRGLAGEVFGARHAFVEPLAGNICDLTVLLAFTEPGGSVAMVPTDAGGYPLGPQWFGRTRRDLAVDPDSFRFDVDACLDVARSADLTVLGCSVIPFPHPVEAFAGEVSPLVFDGAHVLGLIATDAFQDPLAEGADVLIGSTHKSFPGPQGGLVLTNDDAFAERMRWLLQVDDDRGIGLVDNPHPARVLATGVVFELLEANPDYGRRVVANAKAMAGALDDLGVPVRFAERGFTESHQVVLDLTPEEAVSLCRRLDQAGVFVDTIGRIGTAEATWRGLGPDHMETAAHVIAEVYEGAPPAQQRERVAAIAKDAAWLAR